MNDTATTVVAIAAAVAILMVLFALTRARRDKTVRRTRWGFFVERDHYGDRVEEETQVLWPKKEEELQ